MKRLLPLIVSLTPLVAGFRHGLAPLYDSYRLAKSLSEDAGIDASHNHLHSKEVLFWACALLEGEERRVEKNDVLMIGQCAILHDMMDSKYTDFSGVVRDHLGKSHPPSDVDRMMSVMTSMSYSKIVSPDGRVNLPQGEDVVFHTVREADLLSSFNLARMIEYRISGRAGDMSDTHIRKEVIELYMERMARLQERGLFLSKTGRALATALDTIGRLRLRLVRHIDLHGDLDILRVVNHISIHDLISSLERLQRPQPLRFLDDPYHHTQETEFHQTYISCERPDH